jgi:hypothetical protein
MPSDHTKIQLPHQRHSTRLPNLTCQPLKIDLKPSKFHRSETPSGRIVLSLGGIVLFSATFQYSILLLTCGDCPIRQQWFVDTSGSLFSHVCVKVHSRSSGIQRRTLPQLSHLKPPLTRRLYHFATTAGSISPGKLCEARRLSNSAGGLPFWE